ncbi:hypothetical protein TEA_013354 [Camellia sinensis var. sinensis]|uniref:Chlorophyllase n=1 Tax=Camellia sinensis var. sinensis TaxID=542762 RepID=A0A4S4DIF6_CAMSN|nr:hypothetical protein TEA_013354 [Camellia sinensis var. sinensis]
MAVASPALATKVFEEGKLSVKSMKVEESSESSSPPKPLLIVTPTLEGTYPILLFFHGFLIHNTAYEKLLQHVSSHGFIVVAPQGDDDGDGNDGSGEKPKMREIDLDLIITGNEEVNLAGEVTNWLATGLQSMLPENVKANLLNLAVAGHSRGGKTAFALALGHAKTQPSLKISALIGLDPVAGLSIDDQIEPKILTYVPHSFDLPVPISVAIIGTGLGHEKSNAIVPACAPNGVNHCEFFTECKPPSWYFYAKDYGHVDMLDDPNLILSLACVSGEGDKDPFKKCLGGVFVAFLRACLDGENEDLKCIVEEPTIAPVTLDPVIHIEA